MLGIFLNTNNQIFARKKSVSKKRAKERRASRGLDFGKSWSDNEYTSSEVKMLRKLSWS